MEMRSEKNKFIQENKELLFCNSQTEAIRLGLSVKIEIRGVGGGGYSEAIRAELPVKFHW